MNHKVRIIATSLVMTILIFSTAVLLNYSLDFFRIGSIMEVMNEHEINYESYMAEKSFAEVFGGDKCAIMGKKIESLKEEVKKVGLELSSYGRVSFFKKYDYDLLSRRYFLLQLNFLSLIEEANRDCKSPYIPIIFFYKIDDDISERQGYILAEISSEYKQSVITVSLDIDYDKEPLVRLLAQRYNVTKAPTVILPGAAKYERLVYQAELGAVIRKMARDTDFYSEDYNFTFVIDRTGFDINDFKANMSRLLEGNLPAFAAGDITLALGRVAKNQTQVCGSIKFYKKHASASDEERALLLETIASIGCGENKRELLLNASKIWASLGNKFRAGVDYSLANGEEPSLFFNHTSFIDALPSFAQNASSVIIGKSYLTLSKDDILLSQVDRVSRDWLSYQIYSSPFSKNILTVFSERLSYNHSELLPEIGWHEGARIVELKTVGLSHIIASGTLVAEDNGKWYASDENGVFRFEVSIDKVLYPTTRFLRKNLAVIIDTHGVNMLVEQALRNNATAVVGCCDSNGKMEAASYLASKGVKVICFTDKYISLALGSDKSIIGSAPIKHEEGVIKIGAQPVAIKANESIIVEDVADYSRVQSYYDTPARYFRQLENIVKLNTVYVPISEMDSSQRLTEAADFFNSGVIAARVFNSDDYNKLKAWLEKDRKRRVILFHSMAYPYGYKMMKEFQSQVSFGDINPEIR